MTVNAVDSRPPATVEYDRRGTAAWLTLNRPVALNGLTPATVTDFSAALERAGQDEGVRCVVVTGTGRGFCAGVDLTYARELRGQADRALNEFLQPFAALVGDLETFPKPVIAAINGTCVGGGLEILLACDIAIATEDARIGDGHVVYGLLPVTGVARKLVRAVGSGRAHRLLLTGSLHPAAEMMSWGLVDKVVAQEDLVAEVEEQVDLLSRRSPTTLMHLKSMLRQEPDLSDRAAAALELHRAQQHFASGVPQRGIAAFGEGREPDFASEPWPSGRT